MNYDRKSIRNLEAYLHAIWIQLPRRRNPTRLLHLYQATPQRLQLVKDREQCFGDGLGGDNEAIDVGVAAANEVEKGALHVELRWFSVRIQEVAIHPRLVDSVELALVAVQIRLA